MSGRDLEAFYRYERQEHEASSQELLQYHEIIVAAFQYAVELTWLKENPVAHINPCADEAPILFTDFILEWLEMMKNSVELTTYSSYANSIKGSIVPYFKDKMLTLQDLEKHPKHIQDYYQFELGKGLTANTVIHRHANIRKCLQYAFQIGLIKSNPADRVERPRKDKYLATIYNQQELEILFKTVKGDPIELGVILAAFYGLRRSEVVGLKWDAIDFEKKTISIKHTVTQVNVDGKNITVQKDRTKTKSSYRRLSKYRPFPSSLYHSWQKMRVCRLPENTSQAVLQGCAVSGEGGVYHKIAAAETVWVFYLANKVRNAFLFGKALINGDRSDINQIVEPGGLCHVLIHTEKLLSYQTSKSHECAGSMEAPSARYLTLEAPLRPFA